MFEDERRNNGRSFSDGDHQHENPNEKKRERRRRTAFTQVSLTAFHWTFSSGLHASLAFHVLSDTQSLPHSPVESAAVLGTEVQSAKVPFSRRARFRRKDPLLDGNSGQDLVPESEDKVEATEQLSSGSPEWTSSPGVPVIGLFPPASSSAPPSAGTNGSRRRSRTGDCGSEQWH